MTGKRVKLTVEETPAPSDGESEWLEHGNHPLLNDVILDKLIGFVRRCDLKSCRVVSKKWNLRTILHMRSTFKVSIYGNQFYPTGELKPWFLRTGAFVKLFGSNELEIPFESFRLGPFCTTDSDGCQFLQLCEEITTEIDLDGYPSGNYTIEDVSQLLRSSPNIKVLGFPSSLYSRSGDVVKLFPDSMPRFASLKVIKFYQRSYFHAQAPQYCPSAIEELLTAAPNISDIFVSDTPPECYDEEERDEDSTNISCVLNCIEKLGKEFSIQTLSLHNARIRDIHQLRRMKEKQNGLKLKRLRFRPLTNSQDSETELIQLLTIFPDSLQSLNVDLVTENNLMEFSHMPHLQSLAFKAYRSPDPKAVNLAHNFPVLERLTLEFHYEWEDWSEFFSRFQSSPTIKSLRLHGSNMIIQTFNDILRVFPNLTKFDICVGADVVEILRKIWSQMTELESLSISIYLDSTEEVDLDSLFTGIPTQAVEGIGFSLNDFGFDVMTVQQKTDTISKLTERHSQLPSIRNLTKLRHLNLDMNCSNEKNLSDVTAYLAFYAMDHLRHLRVNSCTFSRTSCEIMKKEKGLETWRFSTTGLQNIIPPFVLHAQESYSNYFN